MEAEEKNKVGPPYTAFTSGYAPNTNDVRAICKVETKLTVSEPEKVVGTSEKKL